MTADDLLTRAREGDGNASVQIADCYRNGRSTRAVRAQQACERAHALDDGRPVGTLVLSAVRALAGLPFAAEGSADSRRAAWAAAGARLDELPPLVLCPGLPGGAGTPPGGALASCRDAGHPLPCGGC